MFVFAVSSPHFSLFAVRCFLCVCYVVFFTIMSRFADDTINCFLFTFVSFTLLQVISFGFWSNRNAHRLARFVKPPALAEDQAKQCDTARLGHADP